MNPQYFLAFSIKCNSFIYFCMCIAYATHIYIYERVLCCFVPLCFALFRMILNTITRNSVSFCVYVPLVQVYIYSQMHSIYVCFSTVVLVPFETIHPLRFDVLNRIRWERISEQTTNERGTLFSWSVCTRYGFDEMMYVVCILHRI